MEESLENIMFCEYFDFKAKAECNVMWFTLYNPSSLI